MNKSQFVKKLSVKTGYNEVEMNQIVNAFIDIVSEELCQGNKVNFYGFGNFAQWKQSERPGRNVKTGEPRLIPSRTSVKFKAGKYLLEQLNVEKKK